MSRRGPRKRHPYGPRTLMALQVIVDKPGATVNEVAEALQVSDTMARRHIDWLIQADHVTRSYTRGERGTKPSWEHRATTAGQHEAGRASGTDDDPHVTLVLSIDEAAILTNILHRLTDVARPDATGPLRTARTILTRLEGTPT